MYRAGKYGVSVHISTECVFSAQTTSATVLLHLGGEVLYTCKWRKLAGDKSIQCNLTGKRIYIARRVLRKNPGW